MLQVDDVNDSGNDFNRIKTALSISSMDDLVNYSFTSTQDSTSRDILSVWRIGKDNSLPNPLPYVVYYYNVSGAIVNHNYTHSLGPYALTFTRRT